MDVRLDGNEFRLSEMALREVLEARLKAIEATAEAAATALKAKLDATDITTKERLLHMNRLREENAEDRVRLEKEMRDQRLLLITRPEYERGHSFLEADVRILRETAAKIEGETRGKASVWAVVFAGTIGVLGLIVAVVALIHELMG
jgi:hypothetical protein